MRAFSRVILLILLSICCAQMVTAQNVTDNFTRANSSTLGANWTVAGTNTALQILSNTAEGGTASSWNQEVYTGTGVFSNDQSASITIGTLGGTYTPWVVVRGSSTVSGGTGYMCGENAGALNIYLPSTNTDVATTSATTVAGDIIKCSVRGYTVTLYQNGVQKLSWTDGSTTYSSGYPGVFIYSNSTTAISYFEAHNIDAYTELSQTWSQIQTFTPAISIGGPITSTPAGPWIWTGPGGSCGTPPAATTTQGYSFCIGDSTSGTIQGSYNGDAWLAITRTVGKGTATFATTTIGAGACSAVVSPALTAIASTDTIKWSYQTQPTAGTDAALDMQTWITAGTGLNFKRCNNTGSSIMPTAIVVNWEVTR